MQQEYIQFFSKFIEKELGIIYSESNRYQLQNRLDEMKTTLGFASVDALYEKAKNNMSSDIRQLLLDVATNNETSFHRDPKVFKALNELILPQLFAGDSSERVRIWSAACSYGQEPYGLAMLINEYLKSKNSHQTTEILATDIAVRVLEKAKTGLYTQADVARGLPPQLLQKYFKSNEQGAYQVSSEIKALIQFQKFNLLDSFSQLGKFKFILCRNVLIYQNVDNKKAIIKKLHERLEDQGLLLMGAGESLIGLSDEFDMIRTDDCMLYRKKMGKALAA